MLILSNEEIESFLSMRPVCLSGPVLKELVTGKVEGRANAQESMCFLNNIGLQFSAVGAVVLQEAKARSAGREIPTDWFLESVHPNSRYPGCRSEVYE